MQFGPWLSHPFGWRCSQPCKTSPPPETGYLTKFSLAETFRHMFGQNFCQIFISRFGWVLAKYSVLISFLFYTVSATHSAKIFGWSSASNLCQTVSVNMHKQSGLQTDIQTDMVQWKEDGELNTQTKSNKTLWKQINFTYLNRMYPKCWQAKLRIPANTKYIDTTTHKP